MMEKRVVLFALGIILILGLVSAQDVALDIQIGRQIYSIGENVTYTVILLQDGAPLDEEVKVFISDIANKKSFDFMVEPNKEQLFYLASDFASGYWKIETAYRDKTVKRYFTIAAQESVQFSIEGDTLIIKNTGNTPYDKKIDILIGDKVVSQNVYIDINGYKQIRLVAPQGSYNIQVTDGTTTLSKQDIYLTGTGRVIGALDEQLLKNSPTLGGPSDPEGESFFTAKNFSVAFIFIGAVFGLFILMMVEKVIRKKRFEAAKGMVRLH